MPPRPLTNRAIRAVIHEVCPDDDMERDADDFNAAFVEAMTRYMTADMTPEELERLRTLTQTGDLHAYMQKHAATVADLSTVSIDRASRET